VDVAGLEMLAFLMGEEGGDNGEVAEDELLRQSMADASITAPTFLEWLVGISWQRMKRNL
jgi:hypothetical protein